MSFLKLILMAVFAGLLIEFVQELFTGGERKFQWQEILKNLFRNCNRTCIAAASIGMKPSNYLAAKGKVIR